MANNIPYPATQVGTMFNPNNSYMVQTINYEILALLATRIIDELYDAVKEHQELMVCDWRAYAVLEAYRQYDVIIDSINIPTIEECFDGTVTPKQVSKPEKWKALTEMHEFHWQRSQSTAFANEYEVLLNKTSLALEHYTLSL